MLINWLFGSFVQEQKKAHESKINELNDTISTLNEKIQHLDMVFNQMEISIDVHTKTGSWAVLSIAAGDVDYIKFLQFSPKDLRELQGFLKNFQRCKVDATPPIKQFLTLKNEN